MYRYLKHAKDCTECEGSTPTTARNSRLWQEAKDNARKHEATLQWKEKASNRLIVTKAVTAVETIADKSPSLGKKHKEPASPTTPLPPPKLSKPTPLQPLFKLPTFQVFEDRTPVVTSRPWPSASDQLRPLLRWDPREDRCGTGRSSIDTKDQKIKTISR